MGNISSILKLDNNNINSYKHIIDYKTILCNNEPLLNKMIEKEINILENNISEINKTINKINNTCDVIISRCKTIDKSLFNITECHKLSKHNIHFSNAQGSWDDYDINYIHYN